MRLPRHDTAFRLPVEHPREALARDEALLDQAPREVRWWIPASPAVVVGLGLQHRIGEIVDLERCRAAGVEVLKRRAGGGAVWLDEHMLCGAICLPRGEFSEDVTDSYRALGDRLIVWLRGVGAGPARRIEVDEARADVARLKSRDDEIARMLLATCYGALSPHEVVVGQAKLAGIAQIRRRHAALFQFGILLRDQSPLAEYLRAPSELARAQLREELHTRTIGLEAFTSLAALGERPTV